jgi:PIN domain nuclease of toxin-antitoxin system
LKLLLDTHVWLWSLLDPSLLSPRAQALLSDPKNEKWLSPVSVWESLVLAERGRIALRPSAEAWVRLQLASAPIRRAPFDHEVAIVSRALRLPHRDPADRFIAATARVHEMTLVTSDERLLADPDGYAVLPASL